MNAVSEIEMSRCHGCLCNMHAVNEIKMSRMHFFRSPEPTSRTCSRITSNTSTTCWSTSTRTGTDPTTPAAFRDSMMELIGDGQYVAPVIDTAQLHARLGAPTYLYSFNYPARLDAYPRWAGGVHGDDLSFVFGAPLTDGIDPFSSIYTRSDKLLAETVLKYWTNFIKTGFVDHDSYSIVGSVELISRLVMYRVQTRYDAF